MPKNPDYLTVDVKLQVLGGVEIIAADRNVLHIRIQRRKAWYKTALDIASSLVATASELRTAVLKARHTAKTQGLRHG